MPPDTMFERKKKDVIEEKGMIRNHSVKKVDRLVSFRDLLGD